MQQRGAPPLPRPSDLAAGGLPNDRFQAVQGPVLQIPSVTSRRSITWERAEESSQKDRIPVSVGGLFLSAACADRV